MISLDQLLVLDIETVTQQPDFDKLSERMRLLWEKKAKTIKNDAELSVEELYFDRGAIYAEFGKIVCISAGFFLKENDELHFRVKSFVSDKENELLESFKSVVETKFDQKKLILVAHNGKEFDFPYMARRMLINEIPLPECLRMAGKKPWEVQHLDTMELWKFGDRKSYTSLDLLAAIFDVASSKQDIDGSMVNEVYHHDHDLDKISEYCMRDVAVTAQIFLKMNTLPVVKEENISFIST
jgi:hypothetical protein